MELTTRQKVKKKKGLCVSKRCMNHANHGNYCYKCCKRKQTVKYPIKAAFYNLRTNAKRRGKLFTLSLQDFTNFVIQNENFLRKKGRTCKALTIDRIDNSKGYSFDNIQAITLQENARKGARDFNTTDENKPDYVPF